MEFGRVEHIEEINFLLPPDDRSNEALWQQLSLTPAGPVRLYVGGTQWGRTDWIGKVYPKGTKQKDFLAQYVKQFNCIELNTLFYSLQPKNIIERWASLAGGDFRYCPKFPESISHKQQLVNAGQETRLFIEAVQHLGPALGPSFLQLSEGFGPDRAAILQAYLRSLPRDVQVSVELRHPGWFASDALSPPAASAAAVEATWSLLRELGIGAVLTDVAGRRDVLHMRLTAPVAFIRFAGNNLHSTDFQRIDAWADRISYWISRGLREIYFILHNPEEIYAPDLALYAIEAFNKKCGTSLKPPKLLNGMEGQNLTLF
jgi:uncharacterized protein YecE (DUF72 family)